MNQKWLVESRVWKKIDLSDTKNFACPALQYFLKKIVTFNDTPSDHSALLPQKVWWRLIWDPRLFLFHHCSSVRQDCLKWKQLHWFDEKIEEKFKKKNEDYFKMCCSIFFNCFCTFINCDLSKWSKQTQKTRSSSVKSSFWILIRSVQNTR